MSVLLCRPFRALEHVVVGKRGERERHEVRALEHVVDLRHKGGRRRALHHEIDSLIELGRSCAHDHGAVLGLCDGIECKRHLAAKLANMLSNGSANLAIADECDAPCAPFCRRTRHAHHAR